MFMKQLNSLGCRGIREHFAPLREYFFGKNLILRYIAEDCLYSVYPTETVVNTSHVFMQLLKSFANEKAIQLTNFLNPHHLFTQVTVATCLLVAKLALNLVEARIIKNSGTPCKLQGNEYLRPLFIYLFNKYYRMLTF